MTSHRPNRDSNAHHGKIWSTTFSHLSFSRPIYVKTEPTATGKYPGAKEYCCWCPITIIIIRCSLNCLMMWCLIIGLLTGFDLIFMKLGVVGVTMVMVHQHHISVILEFYLKLYLCTAYVVNIYNVFYILTTERGVFVCSSSGLCVWPFSPSSTSSKTLSWSSNPLAIWINQTSTMSTIPLFILEGEVYEHTHTRSTLEMYHRRLDIESLALLILCSFISLIALVQKLFCTVNSHGD